MIHIPPLHWRWLFWTPSLICAAVAVGMALTVKETPEEAGFHGVIGDDTGPRQGGVTAPFAQVIRVILSNPAVWITACAYACTGAVRQAVDQWFPRYMQDLYQVDLKSAQFQFLAFLIPFVASAGSLIAGYVSDTLFKGRRAPVAAVLYFLETADHPPGGPIPQRQCGHPVPGPHLLYRQLHSLDPGLGRADGHRRAAHGGVRAGLD